MQFKLVQLNTLHGGEIFQPMMDFLKKENGDILHLQEVFSNEQRIHFPNNLNYSCFQFIQDNFNYPYTAFVKGFEWQVTPETNLPMGNATFSRFSIDSFHSVYMPDHKGFDYNYYSSKQPKDFSDAPASFVASTLHIGDKKVKSINIHGVWGFDGEDNPRRLQMRDQILEEIKNDEYVIVSGDFNTTPDTQTMQGLESKLVNVFKNELRTTFNGKRWKHADPTYVVDYLFVSPNIKVVDHYMPNADISDHMPLVAILEL